MVIVSQCTKIPLPLIHSSVLVPEALLFWDESTSFFINLVPCVHCSSWTDRCLSSLTKKLMYVTLSLGQIDVPLHHPGNPCTSGPMNKHFAFFALRPASISLSRTFSILFNCSSLSTPLTNISLACTIMCLRFQSVDLMNRRKTAGAVLMRKAILVNGHF